MADAILCASGIYAIRNKINGKVYIGSALNVRRRWWQHLSRLRLGNHHSPKLQAAWAKYGAEAFAFEIVESVHDEGLLIQREQHWIDKTNASGQDGYNMRPLADSTLGRKEDPAVTKVRADALRGRYLSAEHKSKISGSLQGRVVSSATRGKISQALMGIKRAPASEETRRKMSLARKGVPHGPMSEDQKAKLSAIHTGRKNGPMSPEHRAAISTAKMGKPYGKRQART